MKNNTRKRIKGGGTNIFEKYDSNDIYKRLNNYLTAVYSLKQAADTLKNTAESKVSISDENASYINQSINASKFVEVSNKFSDLVHNFSNTLSQ